MRTACSAAHGFARKWSWARQTTPSLTDAGRLVAAYAAGRVLRALPEGPTTRGLRAHTVETRLRANGRLLRVRHRLDWGDVTTLYAVFQAQLYRLPALVPGQAPVVVDLGANIGLFSLYLSTLLPTGARFVCVEPHPANLELLRRNLALNGLDATVLPLAIGPERGRARLHVHRDADAHTLDVRPHGPALVETIEVETATLGDVLDMAGVERVDALKIDIEGAERTIFADAGRWAPRVRGPLWLDLHEKLVDRDAVLADLAHAGFRAAPQTWVPGAIGFVPA